LQPAKFVLGLLALCFVYSTNTYAASQDVLYPYQVAWNADGSKLAVATKRGVQVYDADFHLLGSFPSNDPEKYFFPVWSPDGTRLAIGNIILDAATFRPLAIMNTESRPFQWSPDSRWLYSIELTTYKGIERYDGQTGALIETLSTNGIQMADFPILSPDGTRFVANDACCGILMLDAVKGSIIARWNDKYSVDNLVWSSDGNQIAYGALKDVPASTPKTYPLVGDKTRATLVEIHIRDSHSGEMLQSFNTFPYHTGKLYWSPDGNELTFTAADIITWNVQTGLVVDAYRPDKRVLAAAYSPFGGRFVLSLVSDVTPPPPSQIQGFSIQPNAKHVYLDGSFEVISPAPSSEKLAAIQAKCASNAQNAPNVPKSATDLKAYAARIGALTGSQVSAGCKADLLAVAEALIARTS
jgi:WD40 repeat protein